MKLLGKSLIGSAWNRGALIDRILKVAPPDTIPTVLRGRQDARKGRWTVDRELVDLVIRDRRGERVDLPLPPMDYGVWRGLRTVAIIWGIVVLLTVVWWWINRT